MGWAKNDPEGWMEVCRKGVAWKLEAGYQNLTGEHLSEDDALLVNEILISLHEGDTEANKIWDTLLTWANKEVCQAEADRFGGQVDDAMNQQKAKREKG